MDDFFLFIVKWIKLHCLEWRSCYWITTLVRKSIWKLIFEVILRLQSTAVDIVVEYYYILESLCICSDVIMVQFGTQVLFRQTKCWITNNTIKMVASYTVTYKLEKYVATIQTTFPITSCSVRLLAHHRERIKCFFWSFFCDNK